MKFLRTFGIYSVLIGSLSVIACKPRRFHDEARTNATEQNYFPTGKRLEDKKFCAAVRGNGELIMGQFSSLGRIVDEFALIDGLAGGSSASVTNFVYESIISNPWIWKSRTNDCSPLQVRQRVSFLLKSVWEYLDVVMQSPSVQGLMQLATELNDDDIHSLDDFINSPTFTKLKVISKITQKVLAAKGIFGIANPELVQLIQFPKDTDSEEQKAQKLAHLQLAAQSIKTFGKFEIDSPEAFFRPGLISFAALAQKFGFLGNFYAGRIKNFAEMQSLLDECSEKHKGLTWFEFKKKNPECATRFRNLIVEDQKSPATGAIQRLDEPIGRYLPVLVTTSYISDGEESKKIKGFFEDFKSGKKVNKDEFNFFKKLNFAYWGNDLEIQSLKTNIKKRKDLKSQKAYFPIPIDWKTALSLSPAEPGLSSILQVPNTTEYSLGGWSDLHPSLVLKDIGCGEVIYVTRRGGESKFARFQVAKTLGISQEQDTELYNLSNPASSFSQSIKQSNYIYCTDWNSKGTGINELIDKKPPAIEFDAFKAPIYTNGPNRMGLSNPASDSSVPEGCRSF